MHDTCFSLWTPHYQLCASVITINIRVCTSFSWVLYKVTRIRDLLQRKTKQLYTACTKVVFQLLRGERSFHSPIIRKRRNNPWEIRTQLISSPGVVNIFHHHEFPVRESGSIGNYICLRKRKKLQESLVFFFSATFNPSWLHFRSLLADGSRTIILPQLRHRRKRFQRIRRTFRMLIKFTLFTRQVVCLRKETKEIVWTTLLRVTDAGNCVRPRTQQ